MVIWKDDYLEEPLLLLELRELADRFGRLGRVYGFGRWLDGTGVLILRMAFMFVLCFYVFFYFYYYYWYSPFRRIAIVGVVFYILG